MTNRVVIGKCPICGGDVVERERAYSCSNWFNTGCPLTIWKEFFTVKITPEIAKQILETGSSDEVAMYSKNRDSHFIGRIVLKDDGSIGIRR